MSTRSLPPKLSSLTSPSELRQLPESSLPERAQELRQFLIDTVSQRGGHFAAGLGTVELTLALHYVFNTPQDKLIWDVGHQAYPHKVLTGRAHTLESIKRHQGLAPFPHRGESEYDAFGVGHSSTSISAALGMALAADLSDEESLHARKHIAVIGDGAMSAGLAFEALNHAGALETDLLVILNDNEMSISENVGALKNYFARLIAGRVYAGLREGSKKVLKRIPAAWELARRSEEHFKGMVLPGTMFEEMGFNYLGPFDGHDVVGLVRTLKNVKKLKGPQFVHVITQKGKGYAPAEADPIKWHGPGPFDAKLGEIRRESTAAPTYTQVFGHWLCAQAEINPQLVAITPAMREGSGLVEFAQRFPKRYFDVAIAEQHAITLAAGMACEGLQPIVAIYSSFLQRGYDQLIHDVALQNCKVVFAIDRAGLVGGDGATHQGCFDLSFLRCVPNMTIMAPADEAELWSMLSTALTVNGPSAVRYPRGQGRGIPLTNDLPKIPLGQAQLRIQGSSGLLLIGVGPLVGELEAISGQWQASVLNLRFVKPLDEARIIELARSHTHVVVVEENMAAGGVGEAIAALLINQQIFKPFKSFAIQDKFIEHGSRADNLQDAGLDTTQLQEGIRRFFNNSTTSSAT
jgi:1-deoxy-D-xylulose-5-phosphate synthase